MRGLRKVYGDEKKARELFARFKMHGDLPRTLGGRLGIEQLAVAV